VLRSWKTLNSLLLLLLFLSGCGLSNIGNQLGNSVLNQRDPDLVQEALPSYLLLIDSFIADDPDNVPMLRAASGLNALYAAAFLDDKKRGRWMADKSYRYAQKAACLEESSFCGLTALHYNPFVTKLTDFDDDNLEMLSTLATGWLVRIRFNADNFKVVADLPKVEKLLEKIVEIDPEWDAGKPWLFLAILNSLRPPALGGNPEAGRYYFEKALAVAGDDDLGIKVDYARYYARLTYNRELHDRLLKDVLDAEVEVPGKTLRNAMAQQQARQLMKSADDFF